MAKNFLNNLTIPTPCPTDWDSMIGNDQVRFCKHCNLDVHNLSQMTRAKAERLVAQSNGRLCVRYHRRSTGQPLTLPVGQKLHRISRRVSRIAAGAFTATLSVTSAVAQTSTSYQPGNANPVNATKPIARWGLGSSLFGTITDPNGAAISGATVSVSKDEISLYTSTNFAGQFRIDGLRAGSYRIRIEAPGFAADETEGFYLRDNDESKMDRNLRVGAIEEPGAGESTGVITLGGAMAFIAPENPFIRAAQEDDLEALTALIAGKDVNLRDKQSHTTALEHAVRNANREMVQLLLAAGANVNLKNASGETALMMLDDDATSDLIWDLINKGALVNLQDDTGDTALMQAASQNNLEALKTLIDAGAKVDMRNKRGQTALMFAAAEGYVNVVRALVLAGADINATDKEEKNVISYAATSDHLPVIRFLKSKGVFEAVAKTEPEEDE